MLDILTSIIANGTTVGNWGYEPWLPFHNFFPIAVIVSLVLTLFLTFVTEMSVTRSFLWGMSFLTSAISALVVVWALWWKLDLSPSQVFGWWVINCALIMGGQGYLILKDRLVKQRIKDIEEREI